MAGALGGSGPAIRERLRASNIPHGADGLDLIEIPGDGGGHQQQAARSAVVRMLHEVPVACSKAARPVGDGTYFCSEFGEQEAVEDCKRRVASRIVSINTKEPH